MDLKLLALPSECVDIVFKVEWMYKPRLTFFLNECNYNIYLLHLHIYNFVNVTLNYELWSMESWIGNARGWSSQLGYAGNDVTHNIK